jgi:hypothetical protein
MNHKNKFIFGILILSLAIGGCTSSVMDETSNLVEDSHTEELSADLGDLDQLDLELNELNNLTLEELDF